MNSFEIIYESLIFFYSWYICIFNFVNFYSEMQIWYMIYLFFLEKNMYVLI
jgi:hypothetical protein